MTNKQLMEVNKGIKEWGLENVENVILIKSGATNGDIMNAIFDIVEDKHQDKGTINLYFFDLDIAIVVSLDWWNAPYYNNKYVNKMNR